MATGQFCLKWNNFHNSIVTAFESLQSTEELVDVTLMCEGRNVKAHKVILSACSPYFRNLFKVIFHRKYSHIMIFLTCLNSFQETPCKHPIIILKDVLYCDLVAILQFMYQGEVLVDQDGLASFLKTAELLQVSGLAGSTSSKTERLAGDEVNDIAPPPSCKQPASAPLISRPETVNPVRTKSPNSPKPALVKIRNDIAPPVEPIIEKENIITRESDDEPMQSCSYQATENVIIKMESTEDPDYHELDYLEPMEDPGSTTTEEQSILERSLKAQGKFFFCLFYLFVCLFLVA